MSCFEENDNLIFDMTIDVLKETIEVQASEIEKLNHKLEKSLSDCKEKTKTILQNRNEKEEIAKAIKKLIREMKSESNEMALINLDLTDRVAAQALVVDSLELEKSLWLKSTDELNKTILNLETELKRKEDFIAVKISETNATEEKLKCEKLQLTTEFKEKSRLLEETSRDLDDSLEMVAELERSSEEKDTIFLQAMLELGNKVRSTFDDVLKVEDQLSNVEKDFAELKSEGIKSWEIHCYNLHVSCSQLNKEVNHIQKENQGLFSLLQGSNESFASFRLKSDIERKLQAETIKSNEQLMAAKHDIIAKLRDELSSKDLEVLQLRKDLNELLMP